MKYNVTIRPEKKRVFGKMMKLLQELEVVDQFAPMDENDSEGRPRKEEQTGNDKRNWSTDDLANQYRDLVD